MGKGDRVLWRDVLRYTFQHSIQRPIFGSCNDCFRLLFMLILPVHLEPRLHLRMEVGTLPRLIPWVIPKTRVLALVFHIFLLPYLKSSQTRAIHRKE